MLVFVLTTIKRKLTKDTHIDDWYDTIQNAIKNILTLFIQPQYTHISNRILEY